MSVYTKNAIYDFVYSRVESSFPNAYISGLYEPIVPSFPAVFIREIGNVNNPQNMTFSGVQPVRTSTFEVQIQSNDETSSMSEVYDIFEVVKQAFIDLFYILNDTTVLNEGDGGIFRLRASFRRVIGAADEMPNE